MKEEEDKENKIKELMDKHSDGYYMTSYIADNVRAAMKEYGDWIESSNKQS